MDLTPLNEWLQSLGLVGYLISAGILAAVYFLRQKYGPQPAPTLPGPEPAPANPSPRLDTVAPLLAKILAALGIVPNGKPVTFADVPHDFHMALSTEWDRVNAAKLQDAQRKAKELADGAPTTPTYTTK